MSNVKSEIEKTLEAAEEKLGSLDGVSRHDATRIENAVRDALSVVRSAVPVEQPAAKAKKA